ncbi:alkylmercury lyase family protein [Jiangella asiatica]|uniref:Alkylmercury lyase n=1 Tax=Jiangella asiatica TaxID=2530372 RepID=A0A4R5CQS3_9ACTN|nr:alkylmercury lyase family protein [Jiangella asiatica]TDE01181.1 alkylmercury lyase [Jiangella asiatica]
MTIEVIHVPDCPNLSPMLQRLREVTEIPASTHEVSTEAEAATLGMAGSPTLLINGVDPFAQGESCECGIACRLYRDENNQIVPAPSADQLRAALARATGREQPELADRCGATERDSAAADLSTWRARAVPVEPLERAMHQAILRSFAANGLPPSIDDLHRETGASLRAVADVLRRLHDSDTIRLDAQGAIVVAYPFSARPTRHRVQIGNRIEVHAMCGIDALGISGMLGEDVRIDTTDPVSGDPITVTSIDGRATWDPRSAVAFVGAGAGGGPSADCCCDYLNLFTSRATADDWASAHSSIPGQVLTQPEAEDLATTLFGAILTGNGAVRR